MPEAGIFALLVVLAGACFACGRYLSTAPGIAAIVVMFAGLALLAGGSAVPYALVTAGPWLAGAAVRSRQAMVRSLEERTRELESEQDALARLAVRSERARIARELHDIVAHHLAVIVVQAGAGRVVADEETDASERFARIRSSGEEALAEMERLVDLLHSGDEASHRGIQVLLEQAEASGLDLEAAPLPAGVSLSPELERLAFRVVQEGLTNAMKHAQGSEVKVSLTADADQLRIELWNSAAGTRSALASTGSSLGLDGMRERVESLGGLLEAGPEGGGWSLRVAVPIS